MKVNADGSETAEVLIDDIGGRGLEDDLQLRVLVEAIGIVAIAAVGWPSAGLDVGDAVRLGSKNAQKSLGAHGAGADFDVIRLLNDAAAFGPILFEVEDDLLESGHSG